VGTDSDKTSRTRSEGTSLTTARTEVGAASANQDRQPRVRKGPRRKGSGFSSSFEESGERIG
jgi:hypothetical protein